MIRGTVHDVDAGGAGGRLRALVVLQGEDEPRAVEFWPELREQYGPEKLRAYLLYEADRQRADELAAAAAAAAALERARHALGDGSADPTEFEATDEPADTKAPVDVERMPS